MKEAGFGILIIIGILACAILIATGIHWIGNYGCSQQYGSGWRISGGNTPYCTNSKGEIRGY